jgi:hypothetical protein
MGSGAAVELDQASSENPLGQRASTKAFRRGIRASAKVLSKASRSLRSMKKASSSHSKVIRVRREDWEADNSEAQAFLKSACEQERQLEEEGLIQGP